MLAFEPALPPLPSLAGRTALVTGAAQGIGLGIASALATLGADVIALDRDEFALNDAYSGTEVELLHADVFAEDPSHLAQRILNIRDPIDLVISNVGVATEKRFLELSRDEVERVVTTNLTNPWFLTQELVRRLISTGRPGVIVIISSLHDTFVRLRPDYSTSKAALAMLVKELAYELAPHGIRVNAVSPGAVETARLPADASTVAAARKLIPLGRLGQPQDIARMVAALVSDEFGQYVTGVNLPVDGGLGLHSWAMH
jgi:NAD(P)-dependent dehydrogenase (short-subunit alcohol dehydrogenase family)